MTMLQTVMDSIAYVASDSLQVFFICNLIILVVLVSSLKTGPYDQHRTLCTKQGYNDWTGEESVCYDLPGREVSISVKEVPQSYSLRTDDEKLWMVEVPVVNSTKLCSYENNLRTSEVSQAQIQSIRDDEQLRIEGESFNDNCIVENNNSDEMYDHVEEADDQFRKRVEAFISKMNSRLRDEMMQTARLALCN
ncbi:hypothetical protein QQ045_005483 [Rhodiola kirilowii]